MRAWRLVVDISLRLTTLQWSPCGWAGIPFNPDAYRVLNFFKSKLVILIYANACLLPYNPCVFGIDIVREAMWDRCGFPSLLFRDKTVRLDGLGQMPLYFICNMLVNKRALEKTNFNQRYIVSFSDIFLVTLHFTAVFGVNRKISISYRMVYKMFHVPHFLPELSRKDASLLC